MSRGRLVRPLSVLGVRGLFDEIVRRLIDSSFVVPSVGLNGERSVAGAGPSVSVMIEIFCAQGRRLSFNKEVCGLLFYSKLEAAVRYQITECKNFEFLMWIDVMGGKAPDKVEFLKYTREM